MKKRRRNYLPNGFSFFYIGILLITVLMFTLHNANGTWWFISQSSPLQNGISPHCTNIPGLVRRQRRLCGRHPELMVAVAEGALLAIRECQREFQHSRWNCSIVPRDISVFGRHVQWSASHGTRETSFVHGIMSAAVVHSVTRRCKEGSIPNCACDLTKKGQHGKGSKESFMWGGCSDNIRFGSSFARRFIDAPDILQNDIKAISNLHNNRVGRKSIHKNTRLRCKCHGVSGSCTSRTCWKTLAPFRTSSKWLKRRYNKAIAVTASPDGEGFIPQNEQKTPRRMDLVYMHRSPDFCVANPKKGILGTASRDCNATSASTTIEGSCANLCCGRKFTSRKKIVKKQCKCGFKWCCYVSCKTCESLTVFHKCSPP